MDSIKIMANGEEHELTIDNTMVYLFPTRPEMNHIYFQSGGQNLAIRNEPQLCMHLHGMGFPYCYQPTPRTSEVESYADWVLSQEDMDEELEGFDG